MIIPILNLYNECELLGVVYCRFEHPEQLREGTELIFKGPQKKLPIGDKLGAAGVGFHETRQFRLHHRPDERWEGLQPRLVFLQPKPLPACWKDIEGFQPRERGYGE